MNDQNTGTIIGIQGQVAEVRFVNSPPAVHDLLILADDPLVKMEVYSSSKAQSYFCLVLTPARSITRGAKVINTEKPIMIPAGKEFGPCDRYIR